MCGVRDDDETVRTLGDEFNVYTVAIYTFCGLLDYI